MRIDVVSIFPRYLEPLQLSLVGKAIEAGSVQLHVHDLRDWTSDRHHTVDDTPYGGGAGMVMKPGPWGEVLDSLTPIGAGEVLDSLTPGGAGEVLDSLTPGGAGEVLDSLTPGDLPEGPRLIIPTPAGRRFDQAFASELAGEPHLIFACGRYEGIDARVAEYAGARMRVDEVSVGDYVLAGGEAAVLVMVEAVVRLLPGVLGNPDSLAEESYAAGYEGLLEYPVYTKPPRWRGLDVPEVLLSGHHGRIAQWRRDQALARTRARRPDLLPPELTDLVIEPAEPRDAGELWTLERAAYLTEGRLHRDLDIPPLTETLEELRTGIERGTFLVARLGHRVAGSVRGERRHDWWFVARLMVAPDLQRRGVGERLLERIESLAPPGTRRVQLTTGANSAANLRFYRRRGYVELGRAGRAGEVPLVTLEKPLT